MGVKTKDWGDKFKAISDLMERKSTGLKMHEQHLKEEISTHKGHAFGRHGYQSGWEGQLIRVVSEVTPDQAFDPMGTNPSIRKWTSSAGYIFTYDSSGQTVMNASGKGFTPASTDFQTASGEQSGGFMTPELQNHALIRAMTLAGPLKPYRFVHFPGIKKDWKPMQRIMVVVEPTPYKAFGIGYKRTSSYVKRTRPEVVKLIDHFYNRSSYQTVGILAPPKVSASGTLPGDQDAAAFNDLGDLFQYLGVEPIWQKNALVILDWNQSKNDWSLVTMFPDDKTPEGWAPALKIPGKPWDGKVKGAGGSPQKTFMVPAWAR